MDIPDKAGDLSKRPLPIEAREPESPVRAPLLDKTREPESTVPVIELRAAACGKAILQLPLQIEDVMVEATVDTGAEVTVISEQLYRDLFGKEPHTDNPVKLRNAEAGQEMRAMRDVPVQLHIGGEDYEGKVYVAPIRDQLLLGLDFLQAVDATIHARGGIQIAGYAVPSKVTINSGFPVDP